MSLNLGTERSLLIRSLTRMRWPGSVRVDSHQGVKDREADDNSVNEKVDGEKLMIAHTTRNGGNR
jgi:hypothetical protein